jgi:hypothetical protein
MVERPVKITFAEMRDSGVRGIVVYCSDYRCSHSMALMADHWPGRSRPALAIWFRIGRLALDPGYEIAVQDQADVAIVGVLDLPALFRLLLLFARVKHWHETFR